MRPAAASVRVTGDLSNLSRGADLLVAWAACAANTARGVNTMCCYSTALVLFPSQLAEQMTGFYTACRPPTGSSGTAVRGLQGRVCT